LGHLAIQFLAKAVGAEVFAISHSPNKKEEAMKLGATHFVGLEDIKDNTLDVVLNTTPLNCLLLVFFLSLCFSFVASFVSLPLCT
jgi:D-arabinose 1-dehydrogenase-like Zn-dependent alcohol dehydrogenase